MAMPFALLPYTTADGSATLQATNQLGQVEIYHSRRGALAEAEHVYLQTGLLALPASTITGSIGPIRLLEIGFGTGLNYLLVYKHLQAFEMGNAIEYVGIEPYPIAADVIGTLGYDALLGLPNSLIERVHNQATGIKEAYLPKLSLQLLRSLPNANQTEDKRYQLIFYDAFSPRFQPEMWTEMALAPLSNYAALGCRLVTYCAKTVVRKALEANGWQVQRPPGPWGKREMIAATYLGLDAKKAQTIAY
jgi:tRNA U34 5-methylaminomethyl-2-thiouridine-forming methyltransferase MnmC